MTRLRALCIVFGVANIVAGLAAWPHGLGRSAGYRSMIGSDYRELVTDGKLREVTTDGGDHDHYSTFLVGKLDRAVFGESILVMVVLIGQGCVLTIAGLASSRTVTPV